MTTTRLVPETTPPPSTGSAPAGATATVFRTETRLFLREPGATFWILVFPTALLVILGCIPAFRKPVDDFGGQSLIDLYTPVVIVLAMIMAALQSMPLVLVGYRERGVLRRLAVTPMRPTSLLVAQIVLHAVASLVSAALALTVARLAFDVALPRDFGGWVLAYVLTLLAAMSMGALVSAVASTTKISATLGTILFFPSMFTAGVWLPIASMPQVLRTIVEAFPLGAGTQALTQAAAGAWPDWSHLGIVAAWTAVLLAISSKFFRWE
jgi:ABC-2 type transport system permease protein